MKKILNIIVFAILIISLQSCEPHDINKRYTPSNTINNSSNSNQGELYEPYIEGNSYVFPIKLKKGEKATYKNAEIIFDFIWNDPEIGKLTKLAMKSAGVTRLTVKVYDSKGNLKVITKNQNELYR